MGKRWSRAIRRAAISAIGALLLLAVFAASAQASSPQLSSVRSSEVTRTSVVLEANINPNGKAAAKYRFQYGPESCASSSCVSVPSPEAELPGGTSPVLVKVPVEGLTPGTTYHFRLIAKNGETTTSAEHLFATYDSVFEGLPDNRAYEQASPVNKDGGDAQGTVATVKATPEGNGITFASTFGMPGGKGAQALPTFFASRTAGKWSTQGLLPPPSTGERVRVMGWSPNFSEVFSKTTKLGNPRTQALFEQSTSTEELTQIAPYLPEAEYFYAGSSADGSTVLFESRKALPGVAGALEGPSNLYAWKQGSGVHLAGVLNDGSAPSKGAFAGPYAWSLGSSPVFQRFGGAEQSSYLLDNHAVAPDGSVYFTASVSGQLYLRENPTEPQSPLNGQGECTDSSLACTIHVSGSQKTNGTGEEGHDSVGPQPAAFQAATEDGSEVFFTSHEKLTNDANTGPEQPKPAIGRDTIDGNPAKVEGELIPHQAAAGVAVFGSHIYWADPATGTIGRAKLNGEAVEDVEPAFIEVPQAQCEIETEPETEPGVFKPTSIPATPQYVAVDSEHVYWTNTGLLGQGERPVNGGGTIGRAKLNGEAVEDVEPAFICGEDPTQPGKRLISNPKGIAVNSSNVYWANATDSQFLSIERATLGGTGAKVLLKPFASAIPYGIALDSTHLYFVTDDPGNPFAYLMRVTLEGTEEEFRFIGEAGVRGVAVDGSHVYWTSQSEGAIGRAELDLENLEKTWLGIPGKPNGLAVDGTSVYWSVNGEAATNPGNDLYRFEPSSGALSDMTPDPEGDGAEVQGVLGASNDGSYVYFAANADLDGPGPAKAGDCKGTVDFTNSRWSGECSLYLLHEGQTTFVARLNAGGSRSDSLDWVGTPDETVSTNSYFAKTAFLSADGKTLLFRSQNQLGEYENEGVSELYRYSAETKEISCVSCPPSQAGVGQGPGLGSLVFPALEPSTAIEAVSSRNLSADGDRVFFDTAEALSPEDTNGQGGCPSVGLRSIPACTDVYEWEAPNTPGGSCEEGGPSFSTLDAGCIFLISTGKSKYPSLFADASASGKDVFFFTRQQLVGQDKDELQDVYDARVEGGLASQNPAPPPVPCESAEACHGAGQTPLSESSPATPNFVGPGNLEEKHKKQKAHKKKKKHHKKGKQKKKGKARPGLSQDLPQAGAAQASAQPVSANAPQSQSTASSSGSSTAIHAAAPPGPPVPAWSLTVTPIPSNFAPGAEPEPQYLISATNVGAAPTTSEAAVLKAVLPAGLTPTGFSIIDTDPNVSVKPECQITGQEISCETEEPLHPGRLLLLTLDVEVSGAEGTYETEASVSGGGASLVTTHFPTKVQAEPLSFGILPGFWAPATNEDGSAAVLAGSHPYQQTVSFGFPTVNPGDGQTNDGHPRDFSVELPRGLVGNPAASPVLCTEAELTDKEGCPDASQVGLADVTTLVGAVGTNGISSSPLYNMVPPPGSVAELATDVAEVGIYAHTFAEVRTDSDYGVEAKTPDVLALGTQPIFSVQAQVWGDPSAEAHDSVRGKCTSGKGSCPVERQQDALLTMPSDCSGRLPYEVNADTWEEPSPPAALHRASYESTGLAGNPVSMEGCEELEFEPTIKARPTTNLADSPTGLEFNLHQPTNDELGKRSPALLRDAAIRFPAGMAVNPSQAAGLGACSEAQIGFLGKSESGRLDFSKEPQSCPSDSKIGSLEATSPALVERNEEHQVEEGPEGEAVLRHLHGSIYIAQQSANPFGSLIAVYLAIEDEKTGIVAKLAGKGELDPQTGQITTRFGESPELPIEDISVKLFGGPRGALVTPPYCGKFTTESDLTPWSAPEGKDAFPGSSFQTTAAPNGGACATSEAQMPNAPKISAGTESPTAGAYSPLLFKLSREDGSQRLGKIEATLPTGLSAKLAGVAECSEQDIAKARSREAPGKGALEQADPSCPASSELGTVVGSAGAGPDPYFTSGHAYLAGPYKGAPISVVTIVPAVAGPFDLGAIVVRAAVYLDPATAQGKIVSDPLPSVVQGVPLDVRSIAVRATRPNFTLNPTSCAEKSFGGQVLSTLGQAAPLFERFQVGECAALPFKPKLTAKLFGPTNRGAHPRLKSVFTAKPGEANSAAISFALPRSEFIDQAHFRTICTRVQFAAEQCPAGSIYGHITAYSPLVEYPLEGPVYLRSSTHQLPDVVLALHGPAYQPLFLEVPGHVDSVHGGLRVRFESVPDAPLTKAIFTAQGAKKGLFQNSTNICKGTYRATVKLDAQNGRVSDSQPKLVAQCGKGGKGPKQGGKAKQGGRH